MTPSPTYNKGELFYNTISLSGDELKQAKEQAGLQDQRVLKIFQDAGTKLTPFDVFREYKRLYPEAPIWALRRSITVLTGKGFLVKTDEMKMEKFGKRNYMWKIVEK